ncbi:MAG: hypothetical protein Q8M16_17700 [Pirellulaceae bacterium]|nr:hypothetical protein [Pirellulaceae bacterium]
MTPAICLLLAWVLMSPIEVASRLKIVGFLAISCFPIAYLASQRPGARWTWIWEVFQYYFERVYFVGIRGQSFFELVLTIAISAFGLMLLNRYLSQIMFHRFPVDIGSDGRSMVDRLKDAFWTPIYNDEELALNNRVFNRRMFRFGIGLLVVAAGCFVTGNSEMLFAALSGGMLIVGLLYFWLWTASEVLNPTRALTVLAFGLIAISSLAQITRFTSSISLLIWTSLEYATFVLAIPVPLVLTVISLVLLATSNQLPRRSKKLGSFVSGTAVVRVQPKPMPVMSWVLGCCIWSLCCMAAYWIPQNLDAADMVNKGQISLRDGWNTAQRLKDPVWDFLSNDSNRRYYSKYGPRPISP